MYGYCLYSIHHPTHQTRIALLRQFRTLLSRVLHFAVSQHPMSYNGETNPFYGYYFIPRIFGGSAEISGVDWMISNSESLVLITQKGILLRSMGHSPLVNTHYVDILKTTPLLGLRVGLFTWARQSTQLILKDVLLYEYGSLSLGSNPHE